MLYIFFIAQPLRAMLFYAYKISQTPTRRCVSEFTISTMLRDIKNTIYVQHAYYDFS